MPYPQLDTPAVVVDLDLLERNIAEMARVAADAGVNLRPHIKTHKTPEIARMQLAAGAVGVTCAKVGEAEALVAAGLDDIFVCFPLVTERKIQRLAALARRAKVSTIVDSPEGVLALSTVFSAEPAPIDVLLKIDTGLHRVGVPPERAVGMASLIAEAPGLRFAGICAHEGYTYRAPDAAAREAAGRAGGEQLVATAQALADAGLPCERVSAGSTPGAPYTAAVHGITEIRPGNYVFYDAMQVRLGVVPLERCALRVLVTLVSHAAPDRAIVDGGTKTFTSDLGVHGQGGAPSHGIIVDRPELTLRALSEEHGWLGVEAGAQGPRIGEQLEVIPVHACPVANLAGELVTVRGGEVVGAWRVAAQGLVR